MPTLSPWGRGFRVHLAPGNLSLTHSSPKLHLLILIRQLAAFWLSALNFLHDLFEYSIYCLNILSPDVDMKGLILTQCIQLRA